MKLGYGSAVGHLLKCSAVKLRLSAFVKTFARDSNAHTTYPVEDHCANNEHSLARKLWKTMPGVVADNLGTGLMALSSSATL